MAHIVDTRQYSVADVSFNNSYFRQYFEIGLIYEGVHAKTVVTIKNENMSLLIFHIVWIFPYILVWV